LRNAGGILKQAKTEILTMSIELENFAQRIIFEMIAAETKSYGKCAYKGIGQRLATYLNAEAFDEFVKDAFIMMQPDGGDIYIGRDGLTVGKPKTEAA
jgi:hypothetical protein